MSEYQTVYSVICAFQDLVQCLSAMPAKSRATVRRGSGGWALEVATDTRKPYFEEFLGACRLSWVVVSSPSRDSECPHGL